MNLIEITRNNEKKISDFAEDLALERISLFCKSASKEDIERLASNNDTDIVMYLINNTASYDVIETEEILGFYTELTNETITEDDYYEKELFNTDILFLKINYELQKHLYMQLTDTDI